MKKLTVDLHCHSQMKAYGHSYDLDNDTFINSNHYNHKNSAWWSDWPTQKDLDRNINGIFGLTQFTQSDFRSCADGRVGVVFSSLYPLEQAFTKPLQSEGDLADKVVDWVTGFGKPRIDFVQKMKGMDYFKDMEFENQFNQTHHGKIKDIAGTKLRYRYVRDYDELDHLISTKDDQIHDLFIINSIEGGHALGCGIAPFNAKNNISKILKNVEKLKKDWKYPPLFITLAHHFYNELCGHAKSIGLPDFVLNQKEGMDQGITEEGWKVIELMLDETKGKRIYIDVKHMSLKARKAYYDYLKSRNYDAPIIASHAGVTGYDNKSSAGVNVRSDIREAHKNFNSSDINFFDFELIQIDNSEGIFGIQLDERRIAGKSALRKMKRISRNNYREIYYHAAGLIWKQIQHIAEVLDRNDRFAWGMQALGSDFDGIVNPIDGYFTSAHFKFLDHFLLMHAHNYVKDKIKDRMRNEFNKDIHEEEIVNRFMSENAMRFLERWF